MIVTFQPKGYNYLASINTGNPVRSFVPIVMTLSALVLEFNFVLCIKASTPRFCTRGT